MQILLASKGSNFHMQRQFIFTLVPNLVEPVLDDLNAKLQKKSADIQLRGTRKYANSFDKMHRMFLLALKKYGAFFISFYVTEKVGTSISIKD